MLREAVEILKEPSATKNVLIFLELRAMSLLCNIHKRNNSCFVSENDLSIWLCNRRVQWSKEFLLRLPYTLIGDCFLEIFIRGLSLLQIIPFFWYSKLGKLHHNCLLQFFKLMYSYWWLWPSILYYNKLKLKHDYKKIIQRCHNSKWLKWTYLKYKSNLSLIVGN